MREIKFRAYQKNFKRMLPVTSIEFECNNNEIESITVDNRGVNGEYDAIPWFSTYRDGYEEFTLDSLVLLQYTGLRDKNGNKIFEGDICAHENMYHYPNLLVVEWIEELACFSFVDRTDYHKNYFFQKTNTESGLKVVGNIYDKRRGSKNNI